MDRSPGIKGRRSIEEVAHNRAVQDAAEFHVDVENRVANLERRGGGVAVYEIKVFEDVNDVLVGDGRFWWPIPEDLGEAEIIQVEAGVSTASSGGTVQVQIAHQPGGTGGLSDILSTKISIEAGFKNSMDAAAQPAISGGVWAVNRGDWLRIDIDSAGSGAKGLAVMVALTPSPLGSVTLQGAKGDPGGVTAWRSDWATSTTYTTGDVVNVGGTTYVTIQSHTSEAASQPGVGGSWTTYWMVLAGGQQISTINFLIDGRDFLIDTGLKGYVHIPFACTIVEATLLADIPGNAVVDIWKDNYGNYPPTVADTITSAAPPTLTGAYKNTDTALVGWTTAIGAGDVLAINVNSCSVARKLTLALKVTRS